LALYIIIRINNCMDSVASSGSSRSSTYRFKIWNLLL